MAVFTDLDEANERVDELENELAAALKRVKELDEREDQTNHLLDGISSALDDLPNQPLHSALDFVARLVKQMDEVQ
ncbi:MAG: hypothetical protein ABIQ18_38305 [Umezawaea sp.]